MTRLTALPALALVLGALVLSPSGVRAQAPAADLPLPYAQRPLTLPKMNLRVDVNLAVATASWGGISATSMGLGTGVGFGITDDIEVGGIVLPLVFEIEPGNDVLFGDPTIYGSFRLLSGNFELGAYVRLSVPVNTDVLEINGGVPMLIRLSDSTRLDTGIFFPVSVFTGSDILGVSPDPTVALHLPLAFTVNIMDPLFVGLATGFQIGDLANAGDTISVPLGFNVGYSIGSERPIADLRLELLFPHFLNTSSNVDWDSPFAGIWSITFRANVYIDVGG